MNDISVIMPAYNAEAFIEDAIRSCFAGNLSSIDVVVCDDGSSDRTREIVRDLQGEGLPIKLIRAGGDGPGIARNRAVEEASSAYVCFLDSDDLLAAGALDLIVAQTRDSTSPIFVLGEIVTFSDETEIIPFGTVSSGSIKRQDYRSLLDALAAGKVMVTGSFVGVPRTWFLEVGGFSEANINGEDLEFILRLNERGPVRALEGAPLNFGRKHGGNRSLVTQRYFEGAMYIMNEERRGAYGSLDGTKRRAGIIIDHIVAGPMVGCAEGASMQRTRDLFANGWSLSKDPVIRMKLILALGKAHLKQFLIKCGIFDYLKRKQGRAAHV